MAVSSVPPSVAYTLGRPLTSMWPNPIISNRVPTAADTGIVGQEWIYKSGVAATDAVYFLSGIYGGVPSWLTTATAAASITSATFITATTGDITATAGNIVATAGTISTTAGSITSATTLTATSGDITATNGNFVASTSGKTLVLKNGGAGAKAGTTTLVAGASPLISTTGFTANSVVVFERTNLNAGTPGPLYLSTVTAGASFVISSTNVADVSTVNWIIIDQA